MIEKLTVFISIFALSVIFTVVGFYKYAEYAAKAEIARRNLPRKNYNSVKHAFAASRMYSLARHLWLDDTGARWITTEFGYANEWAERYAPRFRAPDSTEEVYKDLSSNLTGIVVGNWLYDRSGSSADRELRILGWLSQMGAFAAAADDRRIPRFSAQQDPGTAIGRFQRDAIDLSTSLMQLLNGRRLEFERDIQ
jgi:hypothetical protein